MLGLGFAIPQVAVTCRTGGGDWLNDPRYASATLVLEADNDRYFAQGIGLRYGAANALSSSILALTRASTGVAQTLAGVQTPFAAGELRRTDKGLLVEGARTNTIRNPRMVGAVAGTPGTAPTFLTIPATTNGLTSSIVGSGVSPLGVDYVRVRWQGTAATTATSNFALLEANNQVAAVNGNTWTLSAFLALAAGSLAGVTPALRLLYNDAGSALLTSQDVSFAAATAIASRFITTFAAANASIAFVNGALALGLTIGNVYDFTLDIGWPQLESGAAAQSVVLPAVGATGSSARVVDDVTVPSAGTYVSLTAGSAYVEWDEVPGAIGVARTLFRVNADASNYLRLFIDTDNKVKLSVVSGNVEQGPVASTGTIAAGQRYKAAMRWAVNDLALALTPALLAGVGADTAATMAVGAVASLGVAQNGSASQLLNGYLRRLVLRTTGRTDAKLLEDVA